MRNINQITAPRVDFLDQNGKIAREWYMYLYNLYAITGGGTGITPIINGGTGLGTLPTNGQLLIGDEGVYTLNTLDVGLGISVTNGPGTITIANTGVLSFSGGTTGLTPVAAAVGVVVLGGVLSAVNGGTGQSSYAIGDLLYADTATTLAKLADVATGNALISGGVATAPAWGKIGLTTHVSGVLPIANGGTNGTATPTAGAVPYGTGTAYAFNAVGTSGQVLTSAGAGIPTWTTPTVGTVTSVGLSLPAEFTVTVSPVTSSGTLTATWASETAKYFFAAPNAANGTPSFRAIVASDIPSLSYVTSVTGTSPVASSGGLTPAISLASGYGDTQNPYAVKTANYVLAGPTTGAAAAPTFRALVAADIPALPYGTGTVTSVSVVSANGFAGTVATSTTTPAITLTTTITGLLKGNGTAISAAVANTDYVPLSTVLTKTADYTITNTDMWIINNKTGSALTLTFPAASSWTGRSITVKNMQAQLVNSASSNIVPIDSTTAGTAILLNVIGNWATMVSDGTNWVIMQAASNNNLLLE